jgi:hypothetical protein
MAQLGGGLRVRLCCTLHALLHTDEIGGRRASRRLTVQILFAAQPTVVVHVQSKSLLLSDVHVQIVEHCSG